MNLEVGKLKDKLDPHFLWKEFSSLLEKGAKYLVFLLLLSLVFYGTFIWYRYVYNFHWSANRVEEYTRSKDRGAVLNEDRLMEATDEKEKRAADYKKDMSDLPDIFKLK